METAVTNLTPPLKLIWGRLAAGALPINVSQNVARLGAITWADDAAVFQFANDPGRAAISHGPMPTEKTWQRGEMKSHHETHQTRESGRTGKSEDRRPKTR